MKDVITLPHTHTCAQKGATNFLHTLVVPRHDHADALATYSQARPHRDVHKWGATRTGHMLAHTTRTHEHIRTATNSHAPLTRRRTHTRTHEHDATMFGDTCALEPPLQHVLTHAMRPWTPCYLTRQRLQLPSICASTQLGST